MDYAHNWTDKKLRRLERKLNREYLEAIESIEAAAKDYFKRFETKDKKWRSWVKQGVKTEKEYQEWRFGQMCVGERWEALKDRLANDMHNVNDIVKEYTRDTQMTVYAGNFNYSTYDIEKRTNIDTNFTLYSKDSVMTILRDDPELLPQPGKKVTSMIAAGMDIRWNKQLIQSAAIQGIMQGMTIPKLAAKLAENVGDKNYKAAVRNARTMITGAQNAGRIESYKRAQRMGIQLQKEWVAVHDGRTRHEHRLLDGQKVNVNEPFEVDGITIRFPGDPTAPGYMVYNCRCTMISQIKGYEIDSVRYRQDNDFDGMSYSEWKNAKAKSNDILLPEEKAKNIKMSYVNQYRRG